MTCCRCGRGPVPMDGRMRDHCAACAIHVRCGVLPGDDELDMAVWIARGTVHADQESGLAV